MRPPIPTSDQKLQDEQQRKQRAAMLPMVIGLIAIGAFAIYTIWDSMRPHVEKRLVTGQMIEYSDYGEGSSEYEYQSYATLSADMLSGTTADSLMLVHAGDRSLISEPAGLTPLPDGERISALARTSGHIAEQIAVWIAPNNWTVEQLVNHYKSTATSQGFTFLDKLAKISDARANLTFFRNSTEPNQAPDQTLFIRIDRQPDQPARVFVWYRFPDRDR